MSIVLVVVALLRCSMAVGQCVEQDKLLASDAPGGLLEFGAAAAVDGDVLIAGAPDKACASGPACGAAYVFRFDSTNWVEEQIITAPSPIRDQRFGKVASLSGDVAMVNGYIFRFDGAVWEFEQRLTSPSCLDDFGPYSKIYRDVALVPKHAGCVHPDGPTVYRFNGSQWMPEQQLLASDIDLGGWVAIGENLALVGATYGHNDAYMVVVFRFNGVSWVEEHRFSRPLDTTASFGDVLALDGDTAIVGASTDDDIACPSGTHCGVAYAYHFDGTNWSDGQRLTPSHRFSHDHFGAALAIHGDSLAIGAYGSHGAVHFFRFDGVSWTQQATMTRSDETSGSGYFGAAVAIHDSAIFAGMRGDGNCRDGHYDTLCGSVYRYPMTVPTRARGEAQGLKKPRSVSFYVPCSPAAAGTETALRVRLVSLNHPNPPYPIAPSIDLTAFEGEVRWVAPPQLVMESETGGGQFWSAQLQCTPYYYNWSAIDLLQLTGSAVVPSSIYEVQNIAPSCAGDEENCAAVSSPIQVGTGRWGDVASYFADQPGFEASQPNILDVVAVVDKFRDVSGAIVAARTDLAPVSPDRKVDVQDIAAAVDAFRGFAYSASISACP